MNKKFLLLVGSSSLLIGCTTHRTSITDHSYRYNDTQPTNNTTVHNHHYAPKKTVQQEDEELLYKAPNPPLEVPTRSRPTPSAVMEYSDARYFYNKPSDYFAATPSYTPINYNIRPFNVVNRPVPAYSRHARPRCY
jgi:hypothetical protein